MLSPLTCLVRIVILYYYFSWENTSAMYAYIYIIRMSIFRAAIVLGTAIPLGLFLVWNGVILGSIPNSEMADKMIDPLQQLKSTNGVVGVSLFRQIAKSLNVKLLDDIQVKRGN